MSDLHTDKIKRWLCPLDAYALDESTTRVTLLEWMNDLVSRPELRGIQLICISRPEHEFMRDMPSLINEGNCLAPDKESVNADIRSYVAAQLSKRRDFLNKNLSQDLLEKIRTKSAIKKALESFPKNLEETYRRMIQRIPADLEKDAIRLLQFLVHSKRPPKLVEAKEVIATQIEYEPRGFDVERRLICEMDVLNYCSSLATVVYKTNKEVHLAHFSVKEYLL
ncbi:hypothetical protein QBC38DRAFT_540368 [Podospora fimiseda]|uniref:Uncharacterized protein n=1 Tax=Podospora fimiseda TaxID=252190 RepID=A0AAN7BEZ5_9PEZI|nr:hypothetical protein QBC38DRAFT_540368 [Podospora fimiseda]